MVNTMNDVRGNSRMGHALHLIRIINPAHFRKGILCCRDWHAVETAPMEG